MKARSIRILLLFFVGAIFLIYHATGCGSGEDNTDADGNGVADAEETDSDGDGTVDAEDSDADGDGFADNEESGGEEEGGGSAGCISTTDGCTDCENECCCGESLIVSGRCNPC